MIMTVEDLRKYINKQIDDEALELKLQALESLIRKYTNNNFQNIYVRAKCKATEEGLEANIPQLKIDDTIQISQSKYNAGLYTVISIDDGVIVLDKELNEENEVTVTKVEYPADVVLGVINLINWELNNRDKVGIQSESISRHSVTYFNMDGDNSEMGYPKSLLGFLKPYKRARF